MFSPIFSIQFLYLVHSWISWYLGAPSDTQHCPVCSEWGTTLVKDILSLGRSNTPLREAIWRKLKERVNCQAYRELEDSNGQVGLKYTKPQRGKGPWPGPQHRAGPRSLVGKRENCLTEARPAMVTPITLAYVMLPCEYRAPSPPS